MTVRATRLAGAAALAALAACVQPPSPLPPPPDGIGRIAVAEPVNRTGKKLDMDEHGAFALVLGPKHSTVPEVLAADLRRELAKRRFDVVAPHGTTPTLRVELTRWEPHATDWSAVTVDLRATVVEAGMARPLWTATRTGWVVPTPDADSRPEAWVAASRTVAERLVEGWRPGKPPAKTPSTPAR